jgi:prevent-host-death family protein
MRTQTVSYVKAHLAEIIDSVRESSDPVLVTQNGAGAVVIQDHEDFERTRKALMLLKLISLGERELSKSEGIPHDKLFATLRTRHQARKRR